MTLHVVVMTCEQRLPRALDLAARLAEPSPALDLIDGSLELDIAVDEGGGGPSAWRSARGAWSLDVRASRTPATHRLVIQDDAVPCRDFIVAAHNAIQARPDSIVVFYVGQHHAGTARYLYDADQCQRWSLLPRGYFVPTVAVAMPTLHAAAMTDWASPRYDGFPFDDEVVGAYRDHAAVDAWATVPCLVDHDNSAPSVVGHAHHGARSAACPVSCYRPEQPPADIEWRTA